MSNAVLPNGVFVDAAPGSGGRLDPQSSLTYLKVRFAPLSGRFGSSESMLAVLGLNRLISIFQEFDALTCSFDSLEKILKKGVALWWGHLYSIRLPLGHHSNGMRNMVGVA